MTSLSYEYYIRVWVCIESLIVFVCVLWNGNHVWGWQRQLQCSMRHTYVLIYTYVCTRPNRASNACTNTHILNGMPREHTKLIHLQVPEPTYSGHTNLLPQNPQSFVGCWVLALLVGLFKSSVNLVVTWFREINCCYFYLLQCLRAVVVHVVAAATVWLQSFGQFFNTFASCYNNVAHVCMYICSVYGLC